MSGRHLRIRALTARNPGAFENRYGGQTALAGSPSSITGDLVLTQSTSEPQPSNGLSKVAAVTFTFWIIKILCTTLGETGGDAITMSFLPSALHISQDAAYAVGTAILAAVFLVAVIVQVKASRFLPFLYWLTIVATTTVGTTLADLADRSGGLGYAWGSALLLGLLR